MNTPTLLSCQYHGNECFEIHGFSTCKFVVQLCNYRKDNKLIIYLF